MIRVIKLDGKGEARGRNGWFIPVKAEVWVIEGNIELDVASKSPGELAPVLVRLSTENWLAVGEALVDEAIRLLKEAGDGEGQHDPEDDSDRA